MAQNEHYKIKYLSAITLGVDFFAQNSALERNSESELEDYGVRCQVSIESSPASEYEASLVDYEDGQAVFCFIYTIAPIGRIDPEVLADALNKFTKTLPGTVRVIGYTPNTAGIQRVENAEWTLPSLITCPDDSLEFCPYVEPGNDAYAMALRWSLDGTNYNQSSSKDWHNVAQIKHKNKRRNNHSILWPKKRRASSGVLGSK